MLTLVIPDGGVDFFFFCSISIPSPYISFLGTSYLGSAEWKPAPREREKEREKELAAAAAPTATLLLLLGTWIGGKLN